MLVQYQQQQQEQLRQQQQQAVAQAPLLVLYQYWHQHVQVRAAGGASSDTYQALTAEQSTKDQDHCLVMTVRTYAVQ